MTRVIVGWAGWIGCAVLLWSASPRWAAFLALVGFGWALIEMTADIWKQRA